MGLVDEHVLEGDSEWFNGWLLAPYHIRCEDEPHYWRVFARKDGQEWSRINPGREMAFKLVKDAIVALEKGVGSGS